MIQLSDPDIVFFQNPVNWRGAPTYDVTVVVDQEISLVALNEAAIKCGDLHLLSNGPDVVPIKTVLPVSPDMPLIGLFHTFIYRPYLGCSTYQMSIFPSQFQRFADFAIGSPWSKFDPAKVIALHTVLIEMVNSMAREVTVLHATIADQSQEWVPPSVVQQGICLDKQVAKILDLRGKPQTAPHDKLVAIDFG
jgi:hypothetical protein